MSVYETQGEKSSPHPMVWVAGFIILAALSGLVINYFAGGDHPQSKKVIQQVTIITPPPPPPEIEKEEPPPPEEEEVEVPEPEEALDDLPDMSEVESLGDNLALDADGTAGSDAFGLAAKKGGRSLLAGGGNPFGLYENMLTRQLYSILLQQVDLRAVEYDVVVRLWLSAKGSLERVELEDSTGSDKVDQAILFALQNIDENLQPPPLEMVQPIRLLIRSRS